MAAPGRDIDGRHGPDGEQTAIQFHLPLAFQDKVDLGGVSMVVRPRILPVLDLCERLQADAERLSSRR